GKALQQIGFRGIANFDLMLQDDEVYFIECNPRLGGSTPQISFNPALLHGLTFTEEFIRALCGKELSAHKPMIPLSDYEGFNLDLDFLSESNAGVQIHTPPAGFYKLSKKELVHMSVHMKDFNKKGTVFLYHILPEKFRLSPRVFTGFVLMHQPLLKPHKKGYAFSVRGKKFLKLAEHLFLKNKI
ncbi:MAG: hypothetical protein V1760_00950, partial [Candidatus Peregrinibacteria bacterium]